MATKQQIKNRLAQVRHAFEGLQNREDIKNTIQYCMIELDDALHEIAEAHFTSGIDFTGKTFGQLTVLGRGSKLKWNNACGYIYNWLCRCTCGHVGEYSRYTLLHGKSNMPLMCQSCQNKLTHSTHGQSRTRLYASWSRKRFFGIFAKIGLPIVFPKPTHSKSDASMKPLKPVKDVLDLDDFGKSIFREKPLAERTLERIYAGLIKFVAGGKESFLIKYNSMGANGRYKVPGIDDPCPVVATQNRLGIAHVSFLSKQFSGHPDSKNVSIEEPAGAITCVDHHAFVSVHYGHGYNRSLEDPAPTLTCKDRVALIDCRFIDNQYGNGTPSSVDTVAGSVTTNPKQNLVTCDRFLMNPQFTSAGRSIEDPCFTLIARMDKRPPYLITTESGEIVIEVYESDSPMTRKIKEFMAMYGILDIKMRMLKVDELKKIMGFPEDYVLIGTKCEQKKFIGNAVEVNMSRVLCEALSEALVG